MMNYKLLLVTALLVTIFSCEVSDNLEDVKDELTEITFDVRSYNDQLGIYDSLLIRGSFSEDLTELSIKISNDSEYELTFIEANTSEILAFIPQEVAAGDYELSFTVNDQLITENGSGEPMTITMQSRPLITNISSKSFSAGTEINVSGGPFLNNSGNNSYDPTVWFMTTGYTNTVSEIIVNEAGDQATIIVDADLPAGNYSFLITANQSSQYYTQWSNEVNVIVE